MKTKLIVEVPFVNGQRIVFSATNEIHPYLDTGFILYHGFGDDFIPALVEAMQPTLRDTQHHAIRRDEVIYL